MSDTIFLCYTHILKQVCHENPNLTPVIPNDLRLIFDPITLVENFKLMYMHEPIIDDYSIYGKNYLLTPVTPIALKKFTLK